MNSSATRQQFHCPTCRKTCTVPAGGVRDFPQNFFVNTMISSICRKGKEAKESKTEITQAQFPTGGSWNQCVCQFRGYRCPSVFRSSSVRNVRSTCARSVVKVIDDTRPQGSISSAPSQTSHRARTKKTTMMDTNVLCQMDHSARCTLKNSPSSAWNAERPSVSSVSIGSISTTSVKSSVKLLLS